MKKMITMTMRMMRTTTARTRMSMRVTKWYESGDFLGSWVALSCTGRDDRRAANGRGTKSNGRSGKRRRKLRKRNEREGRQRSCEGPKKSVSVRLSSKESTERRRNEKRKNVKRCERKNARSARRRNEKLRSGYSKRR